MVLSTGFALFRGQKIVKKRKKKCFLKIAIKHGSISGTFAISGLEKRTIEAVPQPKFWNSLNEQ
jgi:hypothetical protein